MKTNFKGTVKDVKINVTNKKIEEYPNFLVLDTEQKTVCLVPFDPVNNLLKHESDAKLIVDSFKVRQQINCDLPELLEQRNEYLKLLVEIKKDSRACHFLSRDIKELLNKIQQDNE